MPPTPAAVRRRVALLVATAAVAAALALAVALVPHAFDGVHPLPLVVALVVLALVSALAAVATRRA